MHARVPGTRGWQRPARRDSKVPADLCEREDDETRRRERHGLGLKVRLLSRGRILLIFACVAAALAPGCGKPSESKSTVAIECEIGPRPLHVGPETITLRLKDPGGKPVIGAHVALEAEMSHAGMSPLFGEAKEVGAGQYQGRLEFAMGGDWIILMHVTLSDGEKFDRQENVPGVAAN